jgi:hypothetical protein
MKKNLLNELNEMKYLFGYERGRVISEQKSLVEDFMDVDPDVAEPEVKPDTDRDKRRRDREEKPFTPGRPDRDPNRLPYEDPDTHPQGDRRGGGDLEDFVMKYLKNRG